jgi:hypothetical protein
VCALVGAAAILAARRVEAAERERRWKEQQEQSAREEQARKELAARVARLEKHLASWQTARDIRAFVAEARAVLADGNKQPAQESNEYLKWALPRAHEVDPLHELCTSDSDEPSRHRDTSSVADDSVCST